MDEDAVNLCKQLLYELPQNDVETKIYQNWVLLANNDLVDGINGFQALDRKCHVAALTGKNRLRVTCSASPRQPVYKKTG
jgi:hypothetical protein